jgi:hypothetical protein
MVAVGSRPPISYTVRFRRARGVRRRSHAGCGCGRDAGAARVGCRRATGVRRRSPAPPASLASRMPAPGEPASARGAAPQRTPVGRGHVPATPAAPPARCRRSPGRGAAAAPGGPGGAAVPPAARRRSSPAPRSSHGFRALAHGYPGEWTRTAIWRRFLHTRPGGCRRVDANRCVMTVSVHSPTKGCASGRKPWFRRPMPGWPTPAADARRPRASRCASVNPSSSGGHPARRIDPPLPPWP